jgi:LCP family protein required for cell wall assembly
LKKLFIILGIILILIMGTVAWGLHYIDSKIYVATKKVASSAKEVTSTVKEAASTTKEVTLAAKKATSVTKGNKLTASNSVSAFQSLVNSISNQSGVDNIILAGTDSRSKETDSRTDSIMMATIDRTNKEVKLTSFMRDMFVPIPGYKKNYKINTAFFLGGPDLLIETLNKNFNVNAGYYITIDFSAFKALVDRFKGIDIDVKEYEIDQMNKYIKEENWGNPEFVKVAGLQHLNGQQVLSYCRIRKAGNNDYERTERQRRVLTLLIQKARKESIFSLPGLLSAILPYIKTNIPSSKLLAFGISAYKFGSTPVSTIRIPADKMYSNQTIGGQDVIVPDFQKNTDLLSQFIASNNSTQNKSNTNEIKNNNNPDAVINNNNPDTIMNNNNPDTIMNNINADTKLLSDNNAANVFNNSRSSALGVANSTTLTQRSTIAVAILNSTHKSGLVSIYKAKLETLGYKVTHTGNYKYRRYSTTVINDYSNQNFGDTLLEDLKFGNVVKKQKLKPLANILIILGRDSENN